MLITIYDSVGNPKVDLSPNDSSTQVKEVQGDSVLTLSFTHYEHIELDVDDYTDFLGERFWLTEKYRPRQNTKMEWVYDLKLYGVESMIKRLLVIKTVDDEENPVFTLTAPPQDHVAMIVKCMNDGMGNITDWKVGQVNGKENIVIDYFGKYCNEALKEIAEKVGTEWWVEGQTVNICKCEHGEPVELGYNKGLQSIDPGTADNVKFYTRLYPVGSSRNIDREKYGFTRLQLPGGQKYVEFNADKYGRVDHFEQSAFEDIYPRRIGSVSSVRSEVKTGEDGNPFTIYYFTDNSLPFDPNDYMIGGLVIRVSFQEGCELAGLGEEEDGTYFFEVNFNSTTREFEIITIWPYDNDIQLPGDKLVPKAGDKYILWNLSMPDEYYALAEEEFLTAVNKYNADHNLDISVYKAPTDHVWIEENAIELTIGRRVRLESEEYFPGIGFRDSRITKITRKVNLPSSMDIEISDALSRTSQEKIADSIAEVRNYAKSLGESVALPDIIRTGDRTPWTDNNLLSALRSLQEFLSKKNDDTAAGLITFLKGLTARAVARLKEGAEFGEFISGMMTGIGGAVDGRGNAEFESVTVRSALRAMELIINRLGAQEGDTIYSESDTIDSCTLNPDGTYTLKVKEKYDGYFTAMTAGMVLKGTVNTLGKGGTDYYTSFMRVNSVNASANTLEVSLYPDDEVPAGRNYPPCPLMKAVRWGHQTDRSKQSLFYVSSTEGRLVKLTGVDRPIIDFWNYEATFGTLPEKISELLPIALGESGLYTKILVAEAIWQLDHQGRPLPTVRDRGPYDPDGDYYSGDMLRPETNDWEHSDTWHNGCRWRCMVTGTDVPPSYDATAWSFIEGDPTFRVELRGGPAAIRPRSFRFTLEVVASIYNEDITHMIADGDIEWTRYTEDSDGNPRTDSDNIWAMRHAQAGKSLTLTEADLDIIAGIVPKVAVFTATVRLRPGTTPVKASYGYRT